MSHTISKIALSIDEASHFSTIGKTRLYQAINDGSLKCRKLGRKSLILTADLEEFLKNLESYTPLTNEVKS